MVHIIMLVNKNMLINSIKQKNKNVLNNDTETAPNETVRPENLPLNSGENETTKTKDNQRQQQTTSKSTTTPSSKNKKSLSDHCFIVLLWAIALVQIWQNRAWFLPLLPLFIIFLVLKRLG